MRYLKFFEQLRNVNIDIKSFPENISDTLSEYDTISFDWNEMMDKHGDNFAKWYRKHNNDKFIENYDEILRKIEEDITTITD